MSKYDKMAVSVAGGEWFPYLQRYSIFSLIENKRPLFWPFYPAFETFFAFYDKKKPEIFFSIRICCTFASQMSAGLWCNGNTADSGPAFPGSSPGSPTAESFS